MNSLLNNARGFAQQHQSVFSLDEIQGGVSSDDEEAAASSTRPEPEPAPVHLATRSPAGGLATPGASAALDDDDLPEIDDDDPLGLNDGDAGVDADHKAMASPSVASVVVDPPADVQSELAASASAPDGAQTSQRVNDGMEAGAAQAAAAAPKDAKSLAKAQAAERMKAAELQTRRARVQQEKEKQQTSKSSPIALQQREQLQQQGAAQNMQRKVVGTAARSLLTALDTFSETIGDISDRVSDKIGESERLQRLGGLAQDVFNLDQIPNTDSQQRAQHVTAGRDSGNSGGIGGGGGSGGGDGSAATVHTVSAKDLLSEAELAQLKAMGGARTGAGPGNAGASRHRGGLSSSVHIGGVSDCMLLLVRRGGPFAFGAEVPPCSDALVLSRPAPPLAPVQQTAAPSPPSSVCSLCALQMSSMSYGFIMSSWTTVILPDELSRMYPKDARHALLLAAFVGVMALMRLATPAMAAVAAYGGEGDVIPLLRRWQRPLVLWGSMATSWILVLLWAASEYRWYRLYAPFAAASMGLFHVVHAAASATVAIAVFGRDNQQTSCESFIASDATSGVMHALGVMLGYIVTGFLENVRDAYPCYALVTFVSALIISATLPPQHEGPRTSSASATSSSRILLASFTPPRPNQAMGSGELAKQEQDAALAIWAARVMIFAAASCCQLQFFFYSRDLIGVAQPKLTATAMCILCLIGSSAALLRAGTRSLPWVAGADHVLASMVIVPCCMLGIVVTGSMGSVGIALGATYGTVLLLGCAFGTWAAELCQLEHAQSPCTTAEANASLLAQRSAPAIGLFLGAVATGTILSRFVDEQNGNRFVAGGYRATMLAGALFAGLAAVATRRVQGLHRPAADAMPLTAVEQE